VHINRLRNKLKKCSGISPIETVRGRGYVLITN
jgi:DNA-binding response OmpR family regulator